MNEVLVTGAAGFIGFHLCQRLLADGKRVLGVDSLDEYYKVELKHDRLAQLLPHPSFDFIQLNLADADVVARLFAQHKFDRVLHMAGQPGVRYSLENPHAYSESNLTGFLNVIEGCRHNRVEHLVFASSSSVYGNSPHASSSVGDPVDRPVSLYAATKQANELMAHAYSHLFQIPTTGLRFFTVYGPWGRPDMAIYKFAEAVCSGKPIDVYNHGRMRRSFTYIDDVVEGVIRIADHIPALTSETTKRSDRGDLPYQIFNIGNDHSVEIERMISLLEAALGRQAVRRYLPMQPGDVTATCANIDNLASAVGYAPTTSIEVGVHRFAEWYLDYSAKNLAGGISTSSAG